MIGTQFASTHPTKAPPAASAHHIHLPSNWAPLARSLAASNASTEGLISVMSLIAVSTLLASADTFSDSASNLMWRSRRPCDADTSWVCHVDTSDLTVLS